MLEIASILLNLHLSTPNLNADLGSKSFPMRIAHEVRTANEVGGTLHIEPDDRPIAGQRSRAWIALTRRGGEIIPYNNCNCRLEVRSLTNKNIRFTVSQMPSILDRYLGLPSIEIVFPQVGRYELRLNGAPKGDEDFPPFELTFTVNVGK